MPRAKRGIDDWAEDRRRELANLFGGNTKPVAKPKSVQQSAATKKVMASKKNTGGSAGRSRRAGSVGVSSSSRQRTNKRGPAKRKKSY